MRLTHAVGAILVAALCTAFPSAPSRSPAQVAACLLPPPLELAIRAPSSDELPAEMQHAVDAVRSALGVSPHAAPAEGVGIEPIVAPREQIGGYRAVNRLTLPPPLMRDPAALARARAAAGRFGATASLVDPGTRRALGDAWQAQWLHDG